MILSILYVFDRTLQIKPSILFVYFVAKSIILLRVAAINLTLFHFAPFFRTSKKLAVSPNFRIITQDTILNRFKFVTFADKIFSLWNLSEGCERDTNCKIIQPRLGASTYCVL